MSYTELTQYSSPNYTPGRPHGIKRIVIHWWDDPARKPGFYGVISTLCKQSRQASAHAVAEDGKVAWLVDCDNIAWHAGNWTVNEDAIGIECSPYASALTLETIAELIANLWGAYGYLPLSGHQQHSQTACPGVYMSKLAWLEQRAREIKNGKPAGRPAPMATAPSKPVPAKSEPTVEELAQAVLRGEYGNGDERRSRLRHRYDEVQARVNELLAGGKKPDTVATPVKDFNALADAVLRGEYGNGDERRQKLGADYDAVQAIVNMKLGAPAKSVPPVRPRIDINALAQAVLRGEYGNGAERQAKLGANYGAVQARVNQLLGL